MNCTTRCFLTSKPGEELCDCEDSIYPLPTTEVLEKHRAYAVSDGTTTSFFSGLWSKIITEHFASKPDDLFDLPWGEWLKPPQQKWQSHMAKIAESNRTSMFTRNGILERRPAAATLAALLLDPPLSNGTVPWKAVILGDSCIFFLRREGPTSIQLTKADQFSNWVAAAESYEARQADLPTTTFSAPHGDEPPLQQGDVVLLATDALSRWLLLRAELGYPVWGTLLTLERTSDFERFIADARSGKTFPLEPDDVALIVLTTGPAHEYIQESFFDPEFELTPDSATHASRTSTNSPDTES